MLVRDAREVAREWVIEEGSRLPGFSGAYHAGSTNWLPGRSTLPPTSDVDVVVVLSDSSRHAGRGKFIYRDVLLEVSYLSSDQLRSPIQVLGDYHLAGGFRTPSVIVDPSGRLTALQTAVSRDYAKRRWVHMRCEHASGRVLEHLGSMNRSASLHDRVTAWLFAAGVTAHVLLVAGLRNPSVRTRYAAVRELLADYDRLDFHETLLELLGCAGMSRKRVEQHLTALESVFDGAATVIRTPFPFASDITVTGRPVAIDGSRDLVERGLHREAVFWIAATYSRCQKVLRHDAPAGMEDRFDAGYQQLLGDLGIASFDGLQERGEEVERFLPRLWEEAEVIMAANPSIED
jgi:hypothetical protein